MQVQWNPRSGKDHSVGELDLAYRVCPNCDGTQMRIVPATSDVPPDNALGGIMRFKTVLHWIVWCSCKEGFVWFAPIAEEG